MAGVGLGWHGVPPESEREELDAMPVDGADVKATLAWIASEYGQWERATDYLHWSPASCRAWPIPAEGELAESASDDEGTHGRKVYRLYARDLWGYFESVPWWGSVDQRETRRANRVGQVLVKEAWHPVLVERVEPDEAGVVRLPVGHETVEGLVYGDGAWYEQGEQADLFVMYRMPRETPGTDEGWVYGVVAPGELPEILNFGLIGSCIECHQASANDRILGQWREPRADDGEAGGERVDRSSGERDDE